MTSEQVEAARTARIDALKSSFSYPRVFAVAEGVVTAAEARVVPTNRADGSEMIATRYTLDVIRSWKSKLPETIEVWSYGGTLPDDVRPDLEYRSTSIFGEAHFSVGERVVIAASHSYTIKAEPKKWHILNGEGGTLRVGKRPEIESTIRSFLAAKQPTFTIGPPPPSPAAGSTDPIYAYDLLGKKWCGSGPIEIGVNVNRQSFVDRGFDLAAVESHVRTGFTWWNESQTRAKFHINQFTTSTSYGNPGPIYSRCCNINDSSDCEDTYFYDNPDVLAYAGSHAFFGGGWPRDLCIYEWKVVIRSNIHDELDPPLACDDPSNWIMFWDDSGDYNLFEVIGHEFGHVLGMDHEVEPLGCRALMTKTFSDPVFSHQEVLGQEALYGKEAGQLETVTASLGANGQLVFDSNLEPVPYTSARWKPVIDSNNGSPWSTPPWDYALAWVDTNGIIHIATAKDGVTGYLDITSAHYTNFKTENAIGMAVGPNNSIGIAWVQIHQGHGSSRDLHFAISYDGGATWDEGAPSSPYGALGGVDLTWAPLYGNWVMTWTRVGGFPKWIVTAMSEDSTGQTWETPDSHLNMGTEDVDLVSPNLAPAIECRNDDSECLMVYRTYDDISIRSVFQRAFVAFPGSLVPLQTTVNTGGDAYSALEVIHLTNEDAWLFTYVWPNTYEDALTYHVKTTGSTGAFNYPRYKYYDAESRSGFDAAYLESSGKIRFLWHGR